MNILINQLLLMIYLIECYQKLPGYTSKEKACENVQFLYLR